MMFEICFKIIWEGEKSRKGIIIIKINHDLAIVATGILKHGGSLYFYVYFYICWTFSIIKVLNREKGKKSIKTTKMK